MTHYRIGAADTTMGMGRNISIIIDSELFARLDKIAKRKNTSKSALVRSLVLPLVEKEEKKTNGKPKQAGCGRD